MYYAHYKPCFYAASGAHHLFGPEKPFTISVLPSFESPVSKTFELPGQQRLTSLFIPFVSLGTLPLPG